MQKIYFITTNSGKVATANRELASLDTEVVQKQIELIEPQADSVVEVVKAKAKQAKALFGGGESFIVLDSGLVIPGLKGFPGVYTKYCDQTIKADGVLALVNATCPANRYAYYEHALAYFNNGQLEIFTDKYEGEIALDAYPTRSEGSWSDFERIFIPKGENRVLAELTREEHEAAKKSAYPCSCWDLLNKHIQEAATPTQ